MRARVNVPQSGGSLLGAVLHVPLTMGSPPSSAALPSDRLLASLASLASARSSPFVFARVDGPHAATAREANVAVTNRTTRPRRGKRDRDEFTFMATGEQERIHSRVSAYPCRVSRHAWLGRDVDVTPAFVARPASTFFRAFLARSPRGMRDGASWRPARSSAMQVALAPARPEAYGAASGLRVRDVLDGDDAQRRAVLGPSRARDVAAPRPTASISARSPRPRSPRSTPSSTSPRERRRPRCRERPAPRRSRLRPRRRRPRCAARTAASRAP